VFALSLLMTTTPCSTPISKTFWFHTKRKSVMAWRSFFGDFICFAFVALHEQHAEFIAAEARKRVGPAECVLECRPSWSRRLSPAMCPQVSFTNLELVEIEEHEWRACCRPFWRGRADSPGCARTGLRFKRPVRGSWLARQRAAA